MTRCYSLESVQIYPGQLLTLKTILDVRGKAVAMKRDSRQMKTAQADGNTVFEGRVLAEGNIVTRGYELGP